MKEKIIASHRDFCRGADAEGDNVFDEDKQALFFLNVYNTGRCNVLCRYLDPTCVTARCNPDLDDGVSGHEDDFGTCPYYIKVSSEH